MCSFGITIAGQHVAILTGFTNTQIVGTVLIVVKVIPVLVVVVETAAAAVTELM